jgi:uncharacterized protein involved in exopolysaccharide biosynthesis
MTTKKSKIESECKRADDEYIDIIDVLGCLWKAKVFVIAGIVLVTATAVGLINSRKPPIFVSSLPVSLEVTGGIMPEAITAKFNSFIARTDVQGELRVKGVPFIGGKLPFKLKIKNDENLVMLEVSSLTPDVTGEKALEASKVLAEVARALNKKTIPQSSASGSTPVTVSDGQLKFAQLAAAQALEEAPARTQLFRLESNLSQKSGLRPTPSTLFNGSSVGDDVLRLLAASEAKLTSTEKEQIIRDYAQLTGTIRAIQAKYEGPLKKMTAALDSSSGVLAGVEKGYPVAVVDEAEYRSNVAIGVHERYENKKWLFIALGVILGALLGLMAYGSAIFFSANKERLKAIF